MLRSRLILSLVVISVMGGFLIGEDPKDPPVKLKGKLPTTFKKLGLTEDQVQSVYKTQAIYTAQIEQLQAKIAQLKKDEKAELEKLLTPAQKARLKELLLGELAEKEKPEKDKSEKDKDEKKDKSKDK